MALGSTQTPTEMNTMNIYCGGKGGRCVGMTTLPPLRVLSVMKHGSLGLLEPSGPVQACNGIALSLGVNNTGIEVGEGEFFWKSHEGRPNERSLIFLLFGTKRFARKAKIFGRTDGLV